MLVDFSLKHLVNTRLMGIKFWRSSSHVTFSAEEVMGVSALVMSCPRVTWRC